MASIDSFSDNDVESSLSDHEHSKEEQKTNKKNVEIIIPTIPTRNITLLSQFQDLSMLKSEINLPEAQISDNAIEKMIPNIPEQDVNVDELHPTKVEPSPSATSNTATESKLKRISLIVDGRLKSGLDKQNVVYGTVLSIYTLFDIVAVIIAFADNTESAVSCSAFSVLKAGLLIELTLIIFIEQIIICLLCTQYGVDNKQICYVNVVLWSIFMVYGVLMVILSVVGCVMWNHMDEKCTDYSSWGSLLLIWCTLKFLGIIIVFLINIVKLKDMKRKPLISSQVQSNYNSIVIAQTEQ